MDMAFLFCISTPIEPWHSSSRVIVSESFEEPQLLDKAVIKLIRTKIWMVNDSESQHGINHATIEMLQG